MSGHKIYAPKGVGVLYVKRGTRLRPWVRGGSQERNRRAGTENIPGIVGMGRAAAIARAELAAESPRLAALRDRLEERLLAIPGTRRNGDGPRVPNTTNVSFAGIEAESLLMALDLAGVAVSTGAACAAGAVEPSHVLRGMGLPMERVQGSVRFSLGRGTHEEDVDRAAELRGGRAVAKQRSLAVDQPLMQRDLIRAPPVVTCVRDFPAPALPRDTTTAPAAPTPRGGSRGRARTRATARTPRACSTAAAGRCSALGRRYWPTVRMSVPAPRMARTVSSISAHSSPRPTMIPLFVSRPALFARCSSSSERLKRAPGPHLAVEARHRLRVVVQDVGPGRDHGVQRGPVSLEVGDQDLHRAAGHARPDLADAGREDRRAPVALVVAVHGGDHGMA